MSLEKGNTLFTPPWSIGHKKGKWARIKNETIHSDEWKVLILKKYIFQGQKQYSVDKYTEEFTQIHENNKGGIISRQREVG